jgi:REP-associated tyrosine transposase
MPTVRPEGTGRVSRRGIGAGEQSVGVCLSVLFRTVCGMSEGRFPRTPGGVCSVGLHLVWCPRYRGRIVGGRVAARCGERLEQVAGGHGGEIVATAVMPDHVHVFVRVGPTGAPARVVRVFTGRTARVLGAGFRYLRRFATVLWSSLYVVASVGCVWGSTVRGDLEHQWDAVAS